MAEPIALPQLVAALRRYGLLLVHDNTLPSIATMIAGEPIRGSWWAHPAAHVIFGRIGQLASHPDSLVMRLVSDKVTFVHRRLWQAVLVVATSREGWQTSGLSAADRRLLSRVERAGSLAATGKVARALESRLLVRGEEFHTERGAHSRWLETWPVWARRVGVSRGRGSVEHARVEIEEAVAALAAGRRGRFRLPWH